MGDRHRLIALALVLSAACASCSSCKRTQDTKRDKPPDHLAPDEVVEGKEVVYGLPLPRAATVKARFASSVHVVSPLTAEELSNFVRKRVKGGKVTPGATSTVLDGITPRDDVNKRLSIDIRGLKSPDGMRSEMTVRDTTPPPLEPGLSDEERWKRAGLRPNGEVLDPKKLQ